MLRYLLHQCINYLNCFFHLWYFISLLYCYVRATRRKTRFICNNINFSVYAEVSFITQLQRFHKIQLKGIRPHSSFKYSRSVAKRPLKWTNNVSRSWRHFKCDTKKLHNIATICIFQINDSILNCAPHSTIYPSNIS